MQEMSKDWPAWRYGPEGAADVFENEDDVPHGWVDHPSKVDDFVEHVDPVSLSGQPVKAVELDAGGHAWDPALHADTKSKTSAGLWRMKPGVGRPVTLDL